MATLTHTPNPLISSSSFYLVPVCYLCGPARTLVSFCALIFTPKLGCLATWLCCRILWSPSPSLWAMPPSFTDVGSCGWLRGLLGVFAVIKAGYHQGSLYSQMGHLSCAYPGTTVAWGRVCTVFLLDCCCPGFRN
jgi:hypothetical protein